ANEHPRTARESRRERPVKALVPEAPYMDEIRSHITKEADPRMDPAEVEPGGGPLLVHPDEVVGVGEIAAKDPIQSADRTAGAGLPERVLDDHRLGSRSGDRSS
ncbi:hypothetical protein QUS59_22610, partial [Xanthomonas citri pv. citri]